MVISGGDFSFGIRYGALDASASVASSESDRHHHFPSARRLHLAWRRDADGRWRSDAEDERRWEVVCAECGDTDGPAENQTEPVQRLRGPYANEHKATRAAKKHFDKN
jgi:hypothetical protein